MDIYGVEPEGAAKFAAAVCEGAPVQIVCHPTLADGLAVPDIGANAFPIARDRLDKLVTVNEDEIVGKPGDYMTSPWFRGGAWRVIAVQLGGVEAILDHYRDQLAESRNASDPLQLARYGEALIAAETARLWVRQACRTAEDPGADPSFVDSYVDLARNAFEQAALRVVAAAQKAIGLRAFLRPNPVERVIRDLSTYLRQPALDASLTSAAAFRLGVPAAA